MVLHVLMIEEENVFSSHSGSETMRLKESWLASTLLLGSVLGCHSPFYEESEDLGLSNSEYVARVAGGGRGYPGALRIDTMYKNDGVNTGRDDCWTKVAISKADYESLWSNEAELVRENGFTSARAGDGRTLDRLLTDELLAPADWSSSPFLPPSWWRPPSTGTPTERTAWRWTVGKENESDTCYAECGCYWVYDAGSETLWVWSWSDRY